MKGIILAAGLGKRLWALTQHIPKPMLKVGDWPIIEYTIRLFKKYGIKDIIINLHYKPKIITDYLKYGKELGVNITYSYERRLLGTAGAIKKVESLLKKTFLVAYGDTLRNINISEMLREHKKNKADVTIAVYRVGNSKDPGIVKMRSDNSIYAFIEKPKRIPNRRKSFANGGTYILEPRVLQSIPKGSRYDFASDLLPLRLNEKGKYRIYGYPVKSYLLDIGAPDSYTKAKNIFRFFKRDI